MRSSTQHRTIAHIVLGATLAVALAACRTAPSPVDTTQMSAPKLVQLAQAAADAGDYQLAMGYYQDIRTRFPTDTERVLWAGYEIALLHHKMDNDEEAVRLLDELIASYGDEVDPAIPQGPRILAEKVRANILAAAAPAAAAPAAAPAPAPASAGAPGETP